MSDSLHIGRSDRETHCRLAGECTTPVDRLEVALDGLCAMHALFYHRYWVLTAVDRRASGQGLVQFAVVMNTQNQVRRPVL